MIKGLPFKIALFLFAAVASFGLMQAEEGGAASSHYNELKQLEWLVGDWADIDPAQDTDIAYNVRWDGNKNFLNQFFYVKKAGKEDLYGNQLIGWDPSIKQIRSWIFDSDGGFGHSVWYLGDNNTWYSTVSFIKPDGGKVSATHVYTKVDNDTYTFASVSREQDGVFLPNLGPYKIVRKK